MIHVTLYFAPENMPIALKACRALFDEAWKEPQLDFCQIVQSADEPGVIRIQEAWNASRKHLEEVRNRICLKRHDAFTRSLSKEDRNHINGLTISQVQLHKSYYVPYLEATEHLWLKPRKYHLCSTYAPYGANRELNYCAGLPYLPGEIQIFERIPDYTAMKPSFLKDELKLQ